MNKTTKKQRSIILPYESVLFMALCFFVLVRIPNYSIPFMESIAKLLVLPLTIFSLVYYFKNNKVSSIFTCILLFWGVIGFSTIINSGDLSQYARAAFSSVLLCTTIENGFQTNKNKTLKALALVLGILAVTNALTQLLYYSESKSLRGMFTDNGGDSNYYFLGQDNGTIFYVLPASIAIALYSMQKNKKITIAYMLPLILFAIAYLRIFSGAGIISSLSFLLIVFCVNMKKEQDCSSNRINAKRILVIVAIVFAFVVLLRTSNPITDLLSELLGKDATFTGRTKLWDIVLGYIAKKPFFGYGIQDDVLRLSMIPYGKAHNTILQLLYNGGFVSLIIFAYSIISSFRNKNKEHFVKEKYLIGCYLLLILLVGNFDFYIYHSFTFLPMILFGVFDRKRSAEK